MNSLAFYRKNEDSKKYRKYFSNLENLENVSAFINLKRHSYSISQFLKSFEDLLNLPNVANLIIKQGFNLQL